MHRQGKKLVLFRRTLKRIPLRGFAVSVYHSWQNVQAIAQSIRIILVFVLLVSPLFFLTRGGVGVPHAYAATSDNLNFQARLETSTGAIAADGYYNIQFKLYDALSGGTLLWTETYYDSNGGTAGNDNRVRVANGYVTVNLGSQTAFPGTMPWDQQLYLTMNVGGTTQTATPTWDGEMSPRLKLTAVPYAFNAKTASELITTAGALSSTLSIQAPTGGNQIFQVADQGAAGTYTLLTGTAANGMYIQLQGTSPGTAQTGNFNINGTGIAGTLQTQNIDTASSGVLSVGATNATNIQIGSNTTDATAKLFILDSYNSGTDPTGYNGAMYYNTSLNKMRCYINAAWVDCDTTGGGSGADTIGALDGGTANANGATISGTTLYLQSASGTMPGLVTTAAQTFAGDKTFADNILISSNKSITITGGNTASRPASPTEGMVYYDTTTKQLLTYANGKWQADRSTATKIVAASNSSQALKDAADYVADGTGDQTEINSALTAAAGGKVYLAEGTYSLSATISIPNDTTLVGAGNGTLVTIPNAQNGSYSLIQNTDTTTGTGVTIRDLKIDGNKANQTSGYNIGVYLLNMGAGSGATATKGATVNNITVVNIRHTSAIILEQSAHSTVTENTIKTIDEHAIYVYSGNNNIISNNHVFDTYLAGIYLYSANDNAVSDNTTQGNTFGGIFLVYSNRNTITGNITSADGFAGITIDASSYNAVTGNTSENNAHSGLRFLNNANHNIASGNKIHNNGDTTSNNGVFIDNADSNTITANSITDTSCTTNCYAINISNSTSDNTYLSDNTFSTSSGTATIQDLGTGTIYAGQAMTQGGLDIRFKQANSTAAVNIQNANGVNVVNIDTTNGELELGNYNGGTNPVAGKIVFATTANSNTVTLASATQTGSFTLIIPNLTANADICTSQNNCGSLTSATGIQLQASTPGTAQTGHFNISGTGIASTFNASTSVLTPLVDTATAVALNIGTTNATSINLNQDTVLAAGQSITITGGNTASRPASPTEGMVYYDTTTKQLLTYANGKWQADRHESTKIVAPSTASQAMKDAADYVADGTSDQVEINAALTAAAGGRVYLMEGTFTTDDAISVPNNTTLAGAGRGTLIQFANINGQTKYMVTNTDQTATSVGVVVRDLYLDGNKTVNATGTMDGIRMYSMGGGSGATARQGATIMNVTANNFNRYGINTDSSGNSTVINNYTLFNGSAGIALGANRGSVSNNQSQGNGQYGIAVNSGSYITMMGNTLVGNGTGGVLIDAASPGLGYNSFIGNIVRDNGSTGSGSSIYVTNSDGNIITGNTITDTAGTGYAINISDSASEKTYLADNTYSGTGATSINDAGTGTIFGGQLAGVPGTGAYTIQNAGGVNVASSATATASTNSSNISITTGNATGATSNSGNIVIDTGTATTTAGTVSIGTTNATTINVGNAGSTTTIQGNTGVTLSATTGTTVVCQNGSGYLATCTNTLLDSTTGIQNQNASAQTTANFWISGTGRADTSVLTPLVDTATATALNIGTTNATSINLNQDTVLAAGQSITITGGNTASRPASPTEGMVYYDTTTKQLLTYANGKWQADRSEAILVAASDSSDADKAAADYIADGDTIAAGDGDQVQINDALTAASASGTRKTGKVYLFAGTYTADATILIPNGVTLAGSGQASIIKLADIDTTDNLIENSDTTTGANITIRDLRLEGQRNLNTAGTQMGIYLLGMGKETSGNDAVNGAFISNVTVYYFRTDGIRIDSSSHNTVTSSIFRDNAQYGLYILGVNSKFNSITANQSEGNNVDGFRLEQGYSNTFSGNVAYDNTSAGMAIASSANSNNIVNNNFRGNNTYGIYVGASALNNISSNNIRGGTTYGIYISGSDGNTINDNNIYDTGGTTTNNAIYLTDSDRNSINGNVVDDTSASTNNYAINVFNSTSNSNYISGNILGDNGAGVTATINDAATDTVYGGQAMALNSTDILFKQTASTTAFRIQNANGTNVLNIDTTNGELELGSYNGGTNPVAGKIVLATTTNSNTVTIQSATQTGNYTLSIPALTANANICTDLGNCSGVNGYIVNQNTAQQASSNFWISGTGRADTSVLTPLLDTPSGTTTLNIGTTNATAGINLNQDVTLAANKGITIPWAAGGNVDAVQIDVNGTSLFNVDTSNSRVTVGSVGGCLGAYGFGQGKLCLNGNVTGVSSYNMQNTTLIMQSSGAGAKIVGNVVNIADTLNTNANDDYGFIVDSTDSTNGNANVYAFTAKVDNGQPGNFLTFQAASNTVFTLSNGGVMTLSGKQLIKSTGTSVFEIQNAGGTATIFSADTTNSRVQVGSVTADSTGVILILDTKNTSGDPTGVNGAMYYNSNSQSFRCYQNGGWRSCINGPVYANTSAGTAVSNTTTETNLLSGYTIAANDCVPGRTYRVTAKGIYGTAGTAPTLNIKLKLGTTVLATTGATTTKASTTNRQWMLSADVICITTGASGSVEAAGSFVYTTAANAAASSDVHWEMANTATVTVDTTTAQALTISAQWGTANASNTITVRQLIIESSGP